MICADELGPVIPRTFAPAPGWSPDGHRIKAPLEYSRGSQKTWVYGGLRVRDGTEVTFCAPSRNTAGWLRLLQEIARTNPRGQVYVIADNLSSHTSGPIRRWLRKHPRIHQVFIPVGACWLNLAEGWWRIFRKAALAGQSFADPDEIDQATRLATPSSTPAPNRGYGDDLRHRTAVYAGSLSTSFEELSTSRPVPFVFLPPGPSREEGRLSLPHELGQLMFRPDLPGSRESHADAARFASTCLTCLNVWRPMYLQIRLTALDNRGKLLCQE